jgi:Spy/CpxP family protein refolding chaperone
MKKISKLYALALAALLAVGSVGTYAVAQSGTGQNDQTKPGAGRRGFGEGRGHRGGRGDRGQGFGFGMMGLGALNLSDAQKAQIKQLHETHRQNTQSVRAELRTKMQELRQANANGTFNEALAAQKLAETAPLRAKLMADEFKLRQETLALLTPEQKTQFEQMRERFKTNRGERGKRSERRATQQTTDIQ